MFKVTVHHKGKFEERWVQVKGDIQVSVIPGFMFYVVILVSYVVLVLVAAYIARFFT